MVCGIMAKPIDITKELAAQALQHYVAAHSAGPNLRAGAIEGVPELEGLTWKDLNTQLEMGRVTGYGVGTSLQDLKEEHGCPSPKNQRPRIIQGVTAETIVQTVLAHIVAEKSRPNADNASIKHGPYAEKITWNGLFNIARVDGVAGKIPGAENAGSTLISDTTTYSLDVLESMGADLGNGKGYNRGKNIVKIPEGLNEEKFAEIVSLVTRKIADPSFQLPTKPEKAVAINARDLFNTLVKLSPDQVCALVDTPTERVNLRGEFMTVAVVDAAFANGTVSDMNRFTSAEPATLSSFRDFAIVCRFYPEDPAAALARAQNQLESAEEAAKLEQTKPLPAAVLHSFG